MSPSTRQLQGLAEPMQDGISQDFSDVFNRLVLFAGGLLRARGLFGVVSPEEIVSDAVAQRIGVHSGHLMVLWAVDSERMEEDVSGRVVYAVRRFLGEMSEEADKADLEKAWMLGRESDERQAEAARSIVARARESLPSPMERQVLDAMLDGHRSIPKIMTATGFGRTQVPQAIECIRQAIRRATNERGNDR